MGTDEFGKMQGLGSPMGVSGKTVGCEVKKDSVPENQVGYGAVGRCAGRDLPGTATQGGVFRLDKNEQPKQHEIVKVGC